MGYYKTDTICVDFYQSLKMNGKHNANMLLHVCIYAWIAKVRNTFNFAFAENKYTSVYILFVSSDGWYSIVYIHVYSIQFTCFYVNLLITDIWQLCEMLCVLGNHVLAHSIWPQAYVMVRNSSRQFKSHTCNQ